MRHITATADRIDHWIRGHVVPNPLQIKVSSARDRRIGLTAIAQCLRDQYDALAPAIPSDLAALVKRLETHK